MCVDSCAELGNAEREYRVAFKNRFGTAENEFFVEVKISMLLPILRTDDE